MTVVTNRPGPAPSEIARIARRMGGTRNEVNETSSTLISSSVPAATGALGETVKSEPVSDPNLAHAQRLAAAHPVTDPNGPAPQPGKPAVAHKRVATATSVAPGNAQLHPSTAHSSDLLK